MKSVAVHSDTDQLVQFRRRNWVAIGLGFLLLIVAASCAVAVALAEDQLSHSGRQARAVRDTQNEVFTDIEDAETGQRGYLLTGDISYLKPFIVAKAGLPGQETKLRSLTIGNTLQTQRVGSIIALVDQKMAELSRAVDLRRSGNADAALMLLRSNVGRDLMTRIRAQSGAFDRAEAKLADQRRTSLTLQRQILVGVILSALVIAIALGLFVAREIKHYANELDHRFRALRLEGEERARVEAQLREAILERQVWADLLEATDDPVAALDQDLRFIAMNQAYQSACERLFGLKFEIGQSLSEALTGQPDVQASSVALWTRALQGENLDYLQSGERSPDGSYYDLKFRPLLDREGRQIGAFQFSRDVTERVRGERRLREAEEALRQSHKMDAVGQLTGGIAHDFNNMLAVVLGSLDLLSRRIGASDARAKRYADAATEAGKRAANLTQRLLAFSRQQPLQPEPLDPNKLVAGMSDLLSHSLGGAVVVQTVLAAGVWRTHADPNQLENVILNLAVNARDAMPDGGKLTIETQNVHFDDRYARANPGVEAGHYVMIALSDTGSGMSKETMAKAFDPFFTTKEVGKGTGLGLSQVYGFVKQTGGNVKIYSEVGEGTTIKIYLPRLRGGAEDARVREDEPHTLQGEGSERILVVEDEPAVRQFSVDALTELGYRVLEASNAASALAILRNDPEISLLFTDVVMPEINGKRLADEALALRPDLKVLFTTGYTRNAVVHNGVLDEGVELIGKPFTVDALAAKVRMVFES